MKTLGKFAKGKKQVEKDKMVLNAFVDEILGGRLRRDMSSEMYEYPGFVVMPNCPCPKNPALIPSIGVFQENCKNVNAFSEWWNSKITDVERDNHFHQELYEYLVIR